jgi:hypothetical protein
VVDPAIENNHFEHSPYIYVYNDPIRLIDPNGLDSLQRAQAVTQAMEYVNKNPGDSYPTVADFKDKKYRGSPGEKVDCAGMVDNCIVAGGEPTSAGNGQDTGVKNLVDQSIAVGLDNAEVGNFLTFNNSESGTDKSKDLGHTGLIKELSRDDKGNITTLKIIDSGGTAGSGVSGPRVVTVIDGGKNRYYGNRITGAYKWDKKPDTVNGGNIGQVNIISEKQNFKPIPFKGFKF